VQLRNNRALLLSFALPLVLLYALFASFAVKRGIILGAPQFKVAAALTLGMASIAILGYSMTVARDREKGVFQRLRVTPAPTWTIMASRLLVQVAAILAMAVVLLVAADVFEGVSLTVAALDGRGFAVALVQHTLAATTLGNLAPGDRVNLETDVLAKYVERLLPGLRSAE
jgi:riboflavin synthase alpha subunit